MELGARLCPSQIRRSIGDCAHLPGSGNRLSHVRGREILGVGLHQPVLAEKLRLLVADEDVGAILRKLYSLLSAKGAHGTSRVSEADVELGMQQTFGALFWMMQHAENLRRSKKSA